MSDYERNYDERFPDDRLSGADPLRQGQLVMLRLLKIFAATCEELGLSYWLDSGTLLGAVRHGGFIPWDDDVDIAMSREQYEIFLEKAPAILPYDVYLDRSLDFAKLRDRYSTRESLNEGGEPDSVYIDIFPFRRFPRMRKRLARLRMLMPPYGIPAIPRSGGLAYRAYRAGVAAACVGMRVTGLMYLVRFLSLFGPHDSWGYDLAPTWHHHFDDDWIFPLRKIRFEDAEFWAPGRPEPLLRYQYGDYLTPPPEDRRNHHDLRGIRVTEPCGASWALAWPKGGQR